MIQLAGMMNAEGDGAWILDFFKKRSYELRVPSYEKKHLQSNIRRNKKKRMNRSIEIASSRTHRNDRHGELVKDNSDEDNDIDF